MLALGKFFVYVRQTRIVNRSFIIKLNACKSAIVCKAPFTHRAVYVLSFVCCKNMLFEVVRIDDFPFPENLVIFVLKLRVLVNSDAPFFTQPEIQDGLRLVS